MNRILVSITLLVLGCIGLMGMVFAENVQQFIGEDRETHQYEPINIKYWSFSSKNWIHKTIDGSGYAEYSYLEILILQNERMIELLEYQICIELSREQTRFANADVIGKCGEILEK